MKGFGIGEAIGMKQNTSYQISRWDFGNFFVPFGIPKMIVVDADRLFLGCQTKPSQETLLISVHEFERGNNNAIINEVFYRYVDKARRINSADKGRLHQCL